MYLSPVYPHGQRRPIPSTPAVLDQLQNALSDPTASFGEGGNPPTLVARTVLLSVFFSVGIRGPQGLCENT